MRKSLRILSLVMVFVLILSTAAVMFSCEKKGSGKKIVIGLDDNFPPMGYRNDKGDLIGYDIDLAKEVMERLGYEAVFQPIDWKSKELELEGKKVDVLWNGLTILDERKEKMLFTDAYLSNKQIVMVKADSTIKTKADLSDKIVGIQSGSSAIDAVEADAAVRATFKELSQYDENIASFLDLDIGRVDAVVVDEIVAWHYIKENPDKSFVILEENFGDELYGVATRLDDTSLNTEINDTLKKMKEDGKMAEITKTWFGDQKTFVQ